VSEASKGSGAWRWLVLVVAMGLAGWAAFTLYERMGGKALLQPPAAAPKDERLEAFWPRGRRPSKPATWTLPPSSSSRPAA